MDNQAAVYNSRDIVEKFLHQKLLKKGLVWDFHVSGRPNQPSSSSSPSSPPSSEAMRRSHRGVLLSSSGEEEDSQEDSQGVLLHQNPQHHQTHPEAAGQAAGVVHPGVRLQDVLWQAGERLERMYQREVLAQMSGQFVHLTPGSVRRSLAAVRDQLFVDGVNWGRIVALMEFGGAMCVESVKREMTWQVDDIAGWMVESLDTPPLQGWMEENGGWDAFIELYGQARPPAGCWSMRMVFGLAVLGAAGVTLGALFNY
ncbi:apoptosis regulator Bcl-2-like [Polymixia lowei]